MRLPDHLYALACRTDLQYGKAQFARRRGGTLKKTTRIRSGRAQCACVRGSASAIGRTKKSRLQESVGRETREMFKDCAKDRPERRERDSGWIYRFHKAEKHLTFHARATCTLCAHCITSPTHGRVAGCSLHIICLNPPAHCASRSLCSNLDFAWTSSIGSGLRHIAARMSLHGTMKSASDGREIGHIPIREDGNRQPIGRLNKDRPSRSTSFPCRSSFPR